MSTKRLLPETEHALRALGLLVQAGRRERGWTEQELADRVGVTAKTLRKVESGTGTVALATAFEAALLVGVELIAPADELVATTRRLEDRVALLPARVRSRAPEPRDDF